MKRNLSAMFLCLLMIASSLAGCMGNDDSAVTELEDEITMQDEKIADLEAEVATLTTQHQDAVAELATVQSTLQTTQTSLDSAEANASMYNAEISSLEGELDMAQVEISMLYELMSNMSDQSNETIEGMALQIAELNQHMSNLSSMLNESYDRHQENATLVSQLTAERDNLQFALEQANNTIASLLNTYSTVMLTESAEMNYSIQCRGITKELSQGLDNGDGNGTAADGQLHVDEVDSIEHICPSINLVKEIYTGSNNGYPRELTEAGGILYFRANDGTNGSELWKSDGTASGTVMVKDMNPGSAGSEIHYLTPVNNTIYFVLATDVDPDFGWMTQGALYSYIL